MQDKRNRADNKVFLNSQASRWECGNEAQLPEHVSAVGYSLYPTLTHSLSPLGIMSQILPLLHELRGSLGSGTSALPLCKGELRVAQTPDQPFLEVGRWGHSQGREGVRAQSGELALCGSS